MKLWNKASAVVLAVWFFVTIAWAYPVKWSVMTKMLCCPPLEGSKVTKVHINLSTD